MKRKIGAVLVILALMLSVLPMTLVSANTDGPSWIWGTDPASTDEELVLLDAWTGFEYARFALPGDPSGDTELALAGESAQLYYVNGDDDDATVHLLDPSDGSTLGTVTLTGAWDVDGLGNYGGGGGYLYTSGCPVLDMHRYPAAGGSPTFFWSTISDPLAVGGDDTGRIYSTDYDDFAGQYVIAEVDPVNNVAPLNTFASPTQDIVGMAFDGTYLYVSDTNNTLYILDPDVGTVWNSLDLGYTLYALAVTEVLPPLERVKVTGGGTVDWPLGRVTYGFTARNVDDCCGAKGEFVIQARDVGLRVKADVVSLAGLGNNAWLGCVVTQSSDPFIAAVGDEFIIRVVDNGEGKNAAPDQVSSCVPGSSDACSLPLFGLIDWTNGNVQLHY